MIRSSWTHQDRLPKQDGRLKKTGSPQGCFRHAQLRMATARIDTRSLCVIFRPTMAGPATKVLAGQHSHLLSAQTLRQAAMHCRALT